MDLPAVLQRACEVRVATGDDHVDGVPARWVARPTSTEQAGALLRAAAADGLASTPRGAGTRLRWGMPPERLDVLVDTTGLAEVVEHAPGDQVLVVQAGRRLDAIAADLAGHRQRLGIDPPRRGTIGGAVATAASGPMRHFHGAVRDLVIGATFVRADGVVAKAGGKVVKNVAGYDLGKLLTGSLGTLGLLTELAVRLHPVPEATAWVTVPVADPAGAAALVRAVAHTQTYPCAAELDLAPGGSPTLAVQLEGTPAGIDGRVGGLCAELGAAAQGAAQPPAWWGTEPAGAAQVKLTHPIVGGPVALRVALAAAAAAGLTAHLRQSVVVGLTQVGLQTPEGAAPAGPALARFVGECRSRAGDFGGTVVVLEAPAAARAGVDVWGPVAGLELMRAVKDRFDPQRLLSPGRFVGGI